LAAELGGNVQITPVGGTATQYPLAIDGEVLAWKEGDWLSRTQARIDIPVETSWPFMAPGGMGETKRTSPTSVGNAFTVGIDAHAFGFARLAPRRVTVTPTVAPVDKPSKGFEAAVPGEIPTTIEITALESGDATTEEADIVLRKLTRAASASASVTESLLAEVNSTVVTTAYATASVAPADDRLVLVTVFSDSADGSVPAAPTVTGGGMTTWDQVATQAFASQGARITVYRAQEATPGSGAITATFTANQDRCKISVSEFGNVDIAGSSDNGASCVIQSKTGQSASLANSLSVTFDAAFSQENNATYAAFGQQRGSGGSAALAFSAGLGITNISGLTTGGTDAQRTALRTGWKQSEVSTVTASVVAPGTTGYLAGIIIEISSASGGGASADVFQTDTISPTGNSLVLAVVEGFRDAGASAAPTLSGVMTTWTQVASQVFDTDRRITLYRSLQATPVPGKVTITFAAAQDAAAWSILEFGNVDTAGVNGADAVVQSATDTATGATSLSITLSAFGAAANATFGAFATNATSGITPGTGFTEIDDVTEGGGLFTEWRVDNDTGVDASDSASASVNWGGIAIEVKSAAPLGTYTTDLFTPTKERLILASVHNTVTTPGTPTASGFNLTWVEVDSETQGDERVTVFRAMGHSDLAEGALTFDFAGTAQDGVRWSIAEFDGVLTTGDNGANAVVQSVSGTESQSASLTITLAALTDATNATYGAFAATLATGITPGSGYTEVHEEEISGETLETEWRQTGSVTVDASATAGIPGIQFAEGTYTGDDDAARAITGLGFTPKVVIIKPDHATSGQGCIKTDDMPNTSNLANSNEDDAIVSLDADGFTVDGTVVANHTTNVTTITYYWMAWGGSSVATSTYTGDGAATQDVTGVGFDPVMVWVVYPAKNAGKSVRTDTMGSANCVTFTNVVPADEIIALITDGFRVGDSDEVNATSETYYYVAFKAATNLHTGTYTGDGLDSRNLPASAMAFDPQAVFIRLYTGSQLMAVKNESLAGDAAYSFAEAVSAANLIQSLTPATGKFQVGTNATVNSSGLEYHFFAFAQGTGVAAWAGVGIEIQAGSEPGGFAGDPFIYALNGQHNTKMSTDDTPTITVEAQHDFGAAATSGGNPAYFGTQTLGPFWYIPLGRFKTAEVLIATASSGDDTYEEMTAANGYSGPGSVQAQAFTVSSQGFNSALLRGFNGNKVDVSVDGKTFGSDFDVGSSAEIIQALIDSGAVIFIGTDSNLHQFDGSGVSFRLTRFNVADTDLDHGSGMLVPEGSENCLFPHQGVYYWNGSRPIHVSVDAIPLNRAIPGVTHEPFRVKFTEIVYGSDDWLWATGRVTESGSTKTYVFAMNRRAESSVWHTIDRFDGIARLIPIDGALDSNHRLWFADVTGAKYGFLQLGKNGEPDAGRDSLGYGAPSTTYQFYSSRDDWGFPHDLKQLQSIEVKTLNTGATTPVQLKVLRDQGSEESVGTTITDAGVDERFWTLGTNDTAYDTMFLAEVATTAGFSTDTDWQLLSLVARGKLRPKMTREVTFTVDTSRLGTLPDNPESLRTKLEELVEANPPAVLDPYGNSVNLAVTGVDVLSKIPDTQGRVQYLITVHGFIWKTS
jgi:hypothetical protein